MTKKRPTSEKQLRAIALEVAEVMTGVAHQMRLLSMDRRPLAPTRRQLLREVLARTARSVAEVAEDLERLGTPRRGGCRLVAG